MRLAPLIVAALVSSAPAAAQTLDLGHPTAPTFLGTAIGPERSVIIDALASFSISSGGIRVDPLTVSSGSVTFDIYALTGAVPGTSIGTRAGLLASGSAPLVDAGFTFYDVPLAFAFLAGNRYELAFSYAPGGWGVDQFTMEYFSFNNPTGIEANSYAVGGLVRVVDGASMPAGASNAATPHVRLAVTAVPEPGTSVLFASGVLAVGGLAARRRRGVA